MGRKQTSPSASGEWFTNPNFPKFLNSLPHSRRHPPLARLFVSASSLSQRFSICPALQVADQ
ncbi:unnamed protein product [Citrullus colocynthis]|uniref:Uncharacterized protein n=1 Tax=Citrullus colocynthis TaxID=252529 RepID=A0ABP0YV65_9ROSI